MGGVKRAQGYRRDWLCSVVGLISHLSLIVNSFPVVDIQHHHKLIPNGLEGMQSSYMAANSIIPVARCLSM